MTNKLATETEATWEPKNNLCCDDLIEAYEAALKQKAQEAASARKPTRGRFSDFDDISDSIAVGKPPPDNPGKPRINNPSPSAPRSTKRSAPTTTASRRKAARNGYGDDADYSLNALKRIDQGKPITARLDSFVVGVDGDSMHYFVSYDLDGYDKIVLKVDEDSMTQMIEMREECRKMYPSVVGVTTGYAPVSDDKPEGEVTSNGVESEEAKAKEGEQETVKEPVEGEVDVAKVAEAAEKAPEAVEKVPEAVVEKEVTAAEPEAAATA